MRPINADVLATEVANFSDVQSYMTYEDIIHIINSAPTLEVKPVIRAYWIIQDKPFSTYQCSNCKEFADEVYDFCPCCGAEMVGKGE